MSAERQPAAVYERELDASLERIWENVLDWEHLPHLHSQAFSSVRMMSEDADGWHGEVGIPGLSGATAEIDVRIDRLNLRYSTRTVSGAGAGTEIVTTLFPRDERRTGIRVEFFVPWAPPGTESATGEFYRTLYVGLWDQDQEMMLGRQREEDAVALATATEGAVQVRSRSDTDAELCLQIGAAGTTVSLGRIRALASQLPLDVELAGRRFRVVGIDGKLHAYDTRCPHLGGPLAADPQNACEVVCAWHGYRFDVQSGGSPEGRPLRLFPKAVVEVRACDGEVWLRLP